MEKIYYNEVGWVCNRHPNNFEIDNEEHYIEVDDETASKTYVTQSGYAWRVVNGELVNEVYDQSVVNEQKTVDDISDLKSELAHIKEDIEQETFGIVREDFAEKKARAAEIINELRVLEGKKPREIISRNL